MHAESLRMDFIPLKHLTEMRQECVELAVMKCSTFLWRNISSYIFELQPDQDKTNTVVPVTCRIPSFIPSVCDSIGGFQYLHVDSDSPRLKQISSRPKKLTWLIRNRLIRNRMEGTKKHTYGRSALYYSAKARTRPLTSRLRLGLDWHPFLTTGLDNPHG